MAEKEVSLSPADAILRSFAIHNRIHIYLLDALPVEAWTAAPADGKGRNIAAIASHIQSVRLMWLKAAGVKTLPDPLEKTATVEQAKQALEASAAALHERLSAALHGDGRIPSFKPDAWAFVGYLIAHEAHHRGQITMLARQTGHPIDKKTNFGLWEWGVR